MDQAILREYYSNGNIYLYKYRTLYQIHYSINAGYSVTKIRTKNTGVPYTMRNMMIAYDTPYLG